jgi:hypothetical protein
MCPIESVLKLMPSETMNITFRALDGSPRRTGRCIEPDAPETIVVASPAADRPRKLRRSTRDEGIKLMGGV